MWEIQFWDLRHTWEQVRLHLMLSPIKKLIVIKGPDGNIETGIKKIGAFLGDNVEIGCGSVLNPGTIVGRESNVYPLSSVRGFVPAGSIYKKQGEVVTKR